MNEKDVCNRLKEIRQQIADANDIPYEPAVCHFEGECQDTCPQCEKELKDEPDPEADMHWDCIVLDYPDNK